MGKKIDLTGQRFGRIVVLHETPKRDKGGNVLWECKCDCGNITCTSSQNLRRGYTKSCGCYNHDIITKDNPKYKRPLYFIYHSMKCRCYNPNDRAFHNYGARGIKISDAWKTYEKFEKWALKNGYKKGLWLDRINNDLDYSPDNCRWATPKEQQNNKRTNVKVNINGVVKTIHEWADYSGIKPMTIKRRIELGWSAEDLLKPIDTRYSHSKEIKRALSKTEVIIESIENDTAGIETNTSK
jgi:hypothetical protein